MERIKITKCEYDDNDGWAQGFADWWQMYEPFGFDHPATYNPVANAFAEADIEIRRLEKEIKTLTKGLPN